MINIEIKIKVAAAGGDYGKLQLQIWHQSTPITYSNDTYRIPPQVCLRSGNHLSRVSLSVLKI